MAKPKAKQPWFKFFPANWRGNPELRLCSIGARGLWMEMLCLMHEAEPYGHLVNNGLPVSNKQLAALAGISLTDTMKFMCEMEAAGVYSRTEDKVIYSRKMVRDKAKADQAKDWGSAGGNPELVGDVKGRVNPPVKGKDKPKKQEQSSSPIDQAAAAEAALDENGLKQETALKALFVSIRSSLGWSIPNLDHIKIWLLAGVPQGTISAAVTPILKRKEDMVSLAYCDSAVREANAVAGVAAITSGQFREFVIVGTPEWNAWQMVSGPRGTPTRERRDAEGRLQTGWDFPTRWPAGFDEATGERIAPSNSEENAA